MVTGQCHPTATLLPLFCHLNNTLLPHSIEATVNTGNEGTFPFYVKRNTKKDLYAIAYALEWQDGGKRVLREWQCVP